jgi:hypothetical protein
MLRYYPSIGISLKLDQVSVIIDFLGGRITVKARYPWCSIGVEVRVVYLGGLNKIGAEGCNNYAGGVSVRGCSAIVLNI